MRVAHELYKRGIPCFCELGDTSRIDLIAHLHPRLVRIQVKALTAYQGAYKLSNVKSAKGYFYLYGRDDVDLFAVYCVDHDCVAWVNPRDFITEGQRSSISLRAEPPQNGQRKGVHLLADYLDFGKAFGLTATK